MARLSIIIPVPGDCRGGDSRGLEETLVSVLENRPDDCQIVVVTGGDYDDPYGLAGEVDFVRAGRGAGLIGCINAGICASRGPIVHPLLCGVVVSPGWADVALAHFEDPAVGAVAPLLLDSEDPPHVVSAGLTYRWDGSSRSIGRGRSPEEALHRRPILCGPDISAGFYRKSVLAMFGLFDVEAGDFLSTLDMALAMQQAGFGRVIEPRCRMWVEQTPAVSESPWRDGWHAERFFWRWRPRKGWLASVAGHSLLVLAECLQCIVRPVTAFRLVGRLLGMMGVLLRPDWRETPESAPATSENVAPPNFLTQMERSSAA